MSTEATDAMVELEFAVETPEAQAAEIQEETSAQVIAQAREFGWKTEDEWKGDPPPDGFLSPDDYLGTSLVQAKIARKEAADLRAQMKVQQDAAADTTSRMERMYQDAAERRREAHEREVTSLREAQRQAAETGDMERYDALAKRHAEMKPPEPAQTAPVSSEVTDWQARNTWFGIDPYATQYAQAVAGNVAQSGGDAAKQMAEVDKQMRQRFPEHFPGAKPKPQRVDGGGLGTIASKSAFDRLPAEAQRQAKADVAEGLYKSVEEYAKFYEGVFGND